MTDLELKTDAVRLGDVERLDHLARDAVDLLDVVLATRPELYAVDLAAQTDNGTADLVALVEVLADERHRERRSDVQEALRGLRRKRRPEEGQDAPGKRDRGGDPGRRGRDLTGRPSDRALSDAMGTFVGRLR